MMIVVLIISFKMEEKMEMGKNENVKGISGECVGQFLQNKTKLECIPRSNTASCILVLPILHDLVPADSSLTQAG